MNYHLIIDHWFLQDFIETAEEVSPLNNTYILTYSLASRHIKTDIDACVVAPYGSKELNVIIDQIKETDRLFIHWFHEPVMSVLERLKTNIPVYLPFWGGDLIMQTKDSFNFNFDPLTKVYLKNLDKFVLWGSPKLLVRKWLDRFKEEKNRRDRIVNDVRIRKALLKRVDFFCHWNLLDMQAVLQVFGGSPQFVPFFYDPKLNRIAQLQALQEVKRGTTVWLGNSDTLTNNHIDAIHALSKFEHEITMNVICPLSYGVNVTYCDYVTSAGEKVFGENWVSLREFMPIDDYFQKQQEADVVVMFHNRTQAAGNVMAFVRMGKKIFLKSQSTLYSFLKNNNIVVFDANKINELSFDEFSRPLTQEESDLNATLIMQLFSDDSRKKGYEKLLIG